MSNSATRASLLLEIRDKGNDRAWTEFVSIYLPLLHSYAMKSGLQDSDAADLAQDTLRQVIANIETFEYKPERGSFRGWLLTIARNLLRRRANQLKKVAIGSGDSGMIEFLSQHAAKVESDSWESEYRERIFQVAAEIVKLEFQNTTWNAFWRCAVDAADVGTVSQELGMSVGAIYIARSRVLARLREESKRLDVESTVY